MSIVAYLSAAAFAVMWVVKTVRHRSHLAQCEQDLRRHQRLTRRLTRCITEMELLLDATPPTNDAQIPEALVGHSHYLYGLRVEASDNANRLSRHALRLRFPDAYLTRVTLAETRCEIVHGALVEAFKSFAQAAREYERGLGTALVQCGDGASARSLRSPVRVLDEDSAETVKSLRDKCSSATAGAADALGLRTFSKGVFDARWPVRRSEVTARHDAYEGEARPMGWDGFGAQPLLHVDAQ